MKEPLDSPIAGVMGQMLWTLLSPEPDESPWDELDQESRKAIIEKAVIFVDAVDKFRSVKRMGDLRNKEFLKDMGNKLKDFLPDQWGYILLAFPFQPDGQMFYTSTATRETAILSLKEFLLKAGAAEDWMQHIK